MNVDMGGLKSLYADALAAYWKFVDAEKAALQSHASYLPALKANTTARNAAEAVRAKGEGIINDILAANVSGQGWSDPKNKDAPVFYRDSAVSMLHYLGTERQVVINDMAAHTTLNLSGSATDEAAASKVDDWAKSNPRGNPNAGKSSQDANHPPVASPPTESGVSASKAGLFAALGIALYWIAGKVLR